MKEQPKHMKKKTPRTKLFKNLAKKFMNEIKFQYNLYKEIKVASFLGGFDKLTKEQQSDKFPTLNEYYKRMEDKKTSMPDRVNLNKRFNTAMKQFENGRGPEPMEMSQDLGDGRIKGMSQYKGKYDTNDKNHSYVTVDHNNGFSETYRVNKGDEDDLDFSAPSDGVTYKDGSEASERQKQKAMAEQNIQAGIGKQGQYLRDNGLTEDEILKTEAEGYRQAPKMTSKQRKGRGVELYIRDSQVVTDISGESQYFIKAIKRNDIENQKTDYDADFLTNREITGKDGKTHVTHWQPVGKETYYKICELNNIKDGKNIRPKDGVTIAANLYEDENNDLKINGNAKNIKRSTKPDINVNSLLQAGVAKAQEAVAKYDEMHKKAADKIEDYTADVLDL